MSWTLFATVLLAMALPHPAASAPIVQGHGAMDPDGATGAGGPPVPVPAPDPPHGDDPGAVAGDSSFVEPPATRVLLESGYGPSFRRSGRRMGFGAMGVERFVRQGLSLGLAANGMRFREPEGAVPGASVQLVLRWYARSASSLSPYAHLGSGGIVTSDAVPSHGTRYNFSSDLGLGIAAQVTGRSGIMVGARWNHVSNASLGKNNPGRDTVYGYLGVSRAF